MNKKDICSYNYDELKEEMLAIGEKAFRSKQIYEWLHVKLADDFDEMTNLSKGLREKLKENYEIRKVKMIDHQISKVDPTEKFLFELEDGNMVESVLMKYNYGNSVCISSQAGCRMGCSSSTSSSTLDTVDSPNSFVVRIFNTPVRLIQPLMISSPAFASLGTLSPVNALVFSVEVPSTTTPSIGTFSPG